MNPKTSQVKAKAVPKLLILSSNPRRDLNLEREFSDLTSAVRRLGKFDVEYRLGVQAQELPQRLAEHSPQFVHFSGHGTGSQGLVFQDESGQEQLVSTAVLARLFKVFTNEIHCVVLNACDSDHQAAAIVEHINYVVGMNQPILDKAAHTFSVGFYKGLAEGRSVEQAYELGCIAIQIWSEGNSRPSPFRSAGQHRKVESLEAAVQTRPPELVEHTKPVLRKRPSLSSAADIMGQAIAPPSERPELPPGFKDVVLQEAKRKEYKDQARTAYDNFGQFSKFFSGEVVQFTKSEYAHRQILLDKVTSFWIEGFLKPSIQKGGVMNLELEDRPDAIASLSQGIEALSVKLDDSFEKLHETQLYEEMGQGRTLLILGEPGAGKTIALLQLAQRLVRRSEQNLGLPMPVVFNLSSWAKAQKPMIDWLVDELRESYQASKALGESWLKQQQLILLLDGLDEVKEEHRNACVRALNEFIGLFPQTEIAICSRIKDYEALGDRLQISSALCLQPLSSKQVSQFLDSAGGSLSGLKTLLKSNIEIEQFAQTPLILSLMSMAYRGWSVERLIPQLGSASDRAQNLFDTYIDRSLARGTTSEYAKHKVLRWLSWLASQMVNERRTIFFIERIQPSWLQTKAQQSRYRRESSLTGGLACGLSFGLVYGVSNVWMIGPAIVIAGLISGLTFATRGNIQLVETLRWSWGATKRSLLTGIIGGFVVGLVVGLILAIVVAFTFSRGNSELSVPLSGVLAIGIVFGLMGSAVGLIFGFSSGLRGPEMQQKTRPNQGIWQSARNAWVLSLIAGLMLGGTIGALGRDWSSMLHNGIIGAVIGWLIGGGSACLRHFSLRLMLYRLGYAPWNYAKFLDFTSDRRLTQKVGGGYIFVHRMLLEHFARMNRTTQ